MIVKMFWNMVYYSSGARSELINISPSKEKSVFQLIGLLNVTLTVLAFGSFALITVVHAKDEGDPYRFILAIVIATILAFIAFHINRLFISSIKKDDTTIILFLENIPKLLFMFFNAVLIGMAFKLIIFSSGEDIIFSSGEDTIKIKEDIIFSLGEDTIKVKEGIIYSLGGDTIRIKQDSTNKASNFIEMYSKVMTKVIDDKIQKRIGIFLDIYFLLLTMSPILIRLLSSKGMYDYILAEVENREFYTSIHLEDTKAPAKDAIKSGSEREEATVNKKILPRKLNKEDLKLKIAKNLTHDVLSILMNQIPNNSEHYNELILCSARLELLNKQKRSGIISNEKHSQERTLINSILLDMTDIINPEN